MVRTLLCILANPPVGDGARTRARVALAGELLGYDAITIGNLFAIPSPSVTDIAILGTGADGWLTARVELQAQLKACAGVLLAYGVAAPTGPARHYYKEQLEWLDDALSGSPLPRYQVGDMPRHPSRWQRWTARQHPQLEFRDALRNSFALLQKGQHHD
ncbi:hypothetical protein GCM10010389_36300 [Streptomyces echinoruber]|uniref:Uncharacterized protein n=1 Tax=Streptomyces echinoruber TaxID=68898 RepID=A0A918RF50_9ACTN|nr:hypothetical protein GCM10010389_36300 [Streptomyces echinoruber]